MLPIRGFVETSLVNWDGKTSAVIFLEGCNLRCAYCHNKEILVISPDKYLDVSYVLYRIREMKSFIDGVVITGGEPLLQEELRYLLQIIRDVGLPIKLDTNGTLPSKLKDVLHLVDYVAMDIKVPFAVNKESIQLLKESSTPHEFRITVASPDVFNDVVEVVKDLGVSESLFLQRVDGINIENLQKECASFVKECVIR